MGIAIYFLFAIFIIVLEVVTGCAVAGWAPKKSVVVRQESPRAFWFAIILHVVVGIVIPLAVLGAAAMGVRWR
jgi:integral membrane sensor domain MASE1